MQLTKSALAALAGYTWPGNIRELNNAMERAVALARNPEITPEDLTDHICACVPRTSPLGMPKNPATPDLPLNLDHAERHLVTRALTITENNKSQAAKLLGISREELRKKMKRMEI